MGLGTFLNRSLNDVGHVAGDIGSFAGRDIVGNAEKVPVLGNVVHFVGHSITDLSQWDRDAYTNGISRPVATFGLEGINMNNWGDALKGSTWSKSWDESAHTSPGQAFMGNVDATFDFGGDHRNADQENKYLQSVFADPGKEDAYFKHGSSIDRVGSGSFDATLGWYSDPGTVVGHGAAGARVAIHSTQGIKTTADAAQALNRRTIQKVLDASDKMTPYQAKKMSWIANSAAPDLYASVFNQNVDRGVKEVAMRLLISGGNDEVAKTALENAAEEGQRHANASLGNFVSAEPAAATAGIAQGTRRLASGAPDLATDTLYQAAKKHELSGNREDLYKAYGAIGKGMIPSARGIAGWGSISDQASGILESIANGQRRFNPQISLAHLEGLGNWQAYSDALHSAADEAEMKLSLPGTQVRMAQDLLNMRGSISWLPGHFDVPISALRSAFSSAGTFGDMNKIAAHVPGGVSAPGRFVTQVIYKGLNQTPLKVLRAFGEKWPEGWINYSDPKAGDTLETFLNRARGMAPAAKQDLLNRFYMAGSDVNKMQEIVQEAEHTASKSTIMNQGFSDEDAEAIMQGTYEHRGKRLDFVSQRANRSRPASQAFSAAKDAAGNTVDLVVHGIDEDGAPMHYPILETMKRQGAPLQDLDVLHDWAYRNSGKFQLLKKGLGTASDVVTQSADLFQDLWKNGVLLRLGFVPRILTDMGLRAVTVLGGTRMLGLAGESIKNELHNLGVTGYDVTNRLMKNRLFPPDTLKSLNDKAGTLTTAHDAARSDYAHALFQKAVDDQVTKVGGRSLPGTPTAEQLASYKDKYESLRDELAATKLEATKYQKTRFGDGKLEIKGVPLTDLYGGENARWLSAQMDSDRILNRMFMRNADMEKGMSGSGAWTTVRADSLNEQEAASHPRAWRHAINNQILGDTLGEQVVRKNWSADDIVKWLKKPAGKAYMKNIPGIFNRDYRDYANRVATHVHQVVPPEIRREIADKNLKGVSTGDLNRLMPNISDRPEINGQLLNYNLGKATGIVNGVQSVQHTLHKYLGAMPINVLVQHPAAVGFYRARVQEAIDKYISFHTPEELSTENKTELQKIMEAPTGPVHIDADTIRKIEEDAAKQAKNDLWSIMYDMTQRSTAAHQLRFLFPFMNAQQEILRHWFNIALDHPYILTRQKQIWNSPGQAGLVYDATTGQKADQNTPLDNQVIRFQIPHGISKIPGLGVLNDLGQMNISKGSINPILQGQHWYIPGAGPIVQVGVQQLSKFNPGLLDNKALKLVLPFGPGDNIAAAVLPTWAQRLQSSLTITNAQYASTFAKVYQTETIRYNEGERTSQPSVGEIQARTQQLLLIQALSAVVLPFSAKYDPGTQTGPQKPRADVTSGVEKASAPDLTRVPIQALIDEYKKLESVDPANAATSFYNKYGQALFALTMSTSKSNAAIPATAAGLAAISDPHIRAMIQADPSVAYAIVGPQAVGGSFDMAAYYAEMNTQIGGGNAEHFRQELDPADMVKQQKAQLGWQQYDQLSSILTSKLQERGLNSLNQAGAEDLKKLKDQFLYNMNDPSDKEDYNPDWYEQFTGAKVDWNARIQSLTALVEDPNLVNNPARTDLKALGTYLEGRQEINQYLAARPNKEGLPSTLADKSNADLAAEWDGFVSGLVVNNTNFALVYQHLLGGDPVNSNLKTNQAFQNSLVVGQ